MLECDGKGEEVYAHDYHATAGILLLCVGSYIYFKKYGQVSRIKSLP